MLESAAGKLVRPGVRAGPADDAVVEAVRLLLEPERAPKGDVDVEAGDGLAWAAFLAAHDGPAAGVADEEAPADADPALAVDDDATADDDALLCQLGCPPATVAGFAADDDEAALPPVPPAVPHFLTAGPADAELLDAAAFTDASAAASLVADAILLARDAQAGLPPVADAALGLAVPDPPPAEEVPDEVADGLFIQLGFAAAPADDEVDDEAADAEVDAAVAGFAQLGFVDAAGVAAEPAAPAPVLLTGGEDEETGLGPSSFGFAGFGPGAGGVATAVADDAVPAAASDSRSLLRNSRFLKPSTVNPRFTHSALSSSSFIAS